jgi:transposase
MTQTLITDAKEVALRQADALNPRPDAVRDPLFAHSDFFDPRDLVQVRYEMVRRVRHDGERVTVVIRAFGVSRSTFAHAQSALTSSGLPGLVPRRRGPRQPSKLRPEVVAVLAQARAEDPLLPATELAQRIAERCGVNIHPRSIQRRLAAARKKGACLLRRSR